ncbi:MAG: hypothetical protein IJW38_04895, partial [Clostridia bacterium]|nr:hypothetical protein [Clostridia bacterium]
MKLKEKEIVIEKKEKEKAFSNIGLRSFLTVVILLASVLILSGALSYFIPQGSFERNEDGAIIVGSYVEEGIGGIAPWRVITAPFRVFVSEDALTVIMISVFLLVMSGVFNMLDKTGGIKVCIGKIMCKLKDKGGPVVCLTVL